MLRIDCSGKTRLALHVPSSHELESVHIIIIIIIIIIMGMGMNMLWAWEWDGHNARINTPDAPVALHKSVYW